MDSLKGADKARAQLVEEVAERTGGIGAAVVMVAKEDRGEAEETGGWGGGGERHCGFLYDAGDSADV
jgi:hypothetical protein